MDNDNEIIVDICDVCYWQYDRVAQEYPDKVIGPNKIALNEARNKYKLYGACKKEFAENGYVRQPLSEEFPENNA